MATTIGNLWQGVINRLNHGSFIVPLSLRLFLAPIMLIAGLNKVLYFKAQVGWIASLGVPFPTVMTALATAAEFGGAFMLLFGIGIRLIAIPLMATMIVAAVTVHLKNGWYALADPGSCLFNCSSLQAGQERKEKAIELLKANGNWDWLSAKGPFTILNNGIEFATTYFVMFLALLYVGAGRVSLDHMVHRALNKPAPVQVDPTLAGIRGWMIAGVILLVLTALIGITNAGVSAYYLSSTGFTLLIVIAAAALLILLGLLVLTVMKLLKENSSTPTLVSWLALGSFLLMGVMFVATYFLTRAETPHRAIIDTVQLWNGYSIIATGLLAGIVLAYFEESKRVKATFIS